MYSTSFSAAAVLLLCSYVASVLAGSDPPRCRRSTDSPGPDVSTIQGPDCFEVPGDRELAVPSDNEFICYRTCIDERADECEACLVRQRSLEIIAPREEEKQELFNGRAIFSPRFTRMTVTYRPSTQCRYRVQCKTGQLLHYIITDHDLQGPQMVQDESRCVDSLSIIRTAVDPPGPQITCGNIMTLGRNRSAYNEDSLSVMFRTNRKVEDDGFYIGVTCVSPDFFGADGCTPAELAQPLIGGAPGSGRKRRDTEMDSLEQVFKVREKRFGFRVPCIKVPTNAAVSYKDNIIRVFRGNEWLYKFPGIKIFQVYNRFVGFQKFCDNAGGRVFRGFGFLKIGVGRAFYIQEGVNPRFRLSELERTVVLQLWNVVLANATVLAAFDYDVDDGLDIRPPGARGPRGTQPAIDTFQLITNNTNACNGVVRATACIVQELVMGIPCDC